MSVTYFKRYRMELDLTDRRFGPSPLPDGYSAHPWNPDLLEPHAEAKYRSFRSEIDAEVFPCLGDLPGCLNLMDEITRKQGFLPAATWLLEYRRPTGRWEYCGTVQGICSEGGFGGVQNLGVTPAHRGQGLGRSLISRALRGFQIAGVRMAYLEVTARNRAAIQLYTRMGFYKVRTMYKAVEVACAK